MAIFQRVAEVGSFRAAAQALGLSPSVVSHHVARLEEELGTALLYRSTRRVSLTEDGRKLLTATTRMIDAAESGLNAVRHDGAEPIGRLTIAAPGAVFETPAHVGLFAEFASLYPKVTLSVRYSDQRVELIGSTFDAAIRVGWLEDSRYLARKLCALDRVLVASDTYLKNHPRPSKLADLANLDWIKLAQFPISRQLTSTTGETPSINPRAAIEVDSVTALCRLAEAGMGVASVPRLLVEESLAEDRLTELSVGWPLVPAGVFIVWPSNVARDGLVRLLVDFLASRLN